MNQEGDTFSEYEFLKAALCHYGEDDCRDFFFETNNNPDGKKGEKPKKHIPTRGDTYENHWKEVLPKEKYLTGENDVSRNICNNYIF